MQRRKGIAMVIGKTKIQITASEEMRRKAEAQVRKSTAGLKLNLSQGETLRLLHELEVHQIELEMQNEELILAKDELELSRNTYAELYDFSPIGYFIFDKSGVIIEVNLTGAELLGKERRFLAAKPFTGFIADERSRELFSRHLDSVLRNEETQRCEVGLQGKDGSLVFAHLKSVMLDKNESKDGFILCSAVDGTLGKKLADDLQKAHDKLELVVQERTVELTKTNIQLLQEIEVRKSAEVSLQKAYSEIKELRDQLQAENIYLKQEVAKQYNYGDIIGQSKALSSVFLQVEQVAPMNATVLLLGETGTGKGMIARAIHSSSVRKNRPLVTVNCTTLPASLVESELFGRERGAYTGSDARQIGRFELADGGTIFL
ncbi:MAG TPA: sigma 54-interacting transcriptional regulator, partial [Geobacteraceae bacterium]|nr:sigma 54-interacting transcriptional regulator [Geobacteraceae bacterium]